MPCGFFPMLFLSQTYNGTIGPTQIIIFMSKMNNNYIDTNLIDIITRYDMTRSDMP